MFIDQGYPLHKILKFALVSPATWYKRRRLLFKAPSPKVGALKRGRRRQLTTDINGNTHDDDKVISFLQEIRKRPHFEKVGYRKLIPFLKKDYNIKMNHKKVFRLYSEGKMSLPKKKKMRRRGKKICENRKIMRPNQLWQFDIKYGYVDGENRFFYLMAFIDVFTREIVHYHVGQRCTAGDILFALQVALKNTKAKVEDLVIRSDNGTQMTSHQFRLGVEKYRLEHEFTPPKTPNLNAYIESFFSIVDRELFQGKVYDSFKMAYGDVVGFIKHYNEVRPHGSLNMMTPCEFANKFNTNNRLESVA